MENITIHRALAELKLLDGRILKKIGEIFPIGFHQKGKLVDNRIEKDKFEKTVPADYQSIIDLIERKDIIKRAIVKSNSEAIITVANKNMTVAEAINYKKLVEYKKTLIMALKNKQLNVMAVFNRNVEHVNGNLQKLLEAAMGGKEGVKGGDKKQIEDISKPFLEINEFHLVDPLKIDEKVKELEQEIGDFEMEVDSALSVSNSTTFIKV